MISAEQVYSQLEKQLESISVVELAMMLEANTSEVRQRLNELGERVAKNEHNEWQIADNIIQEPELSSLSAEEIEERDRLENTVQQAFFVAGQALKTLRDKRLYRETHTSFVSYVKDRFDFTRRAADYLISASEVVENLKREPMVLGTNVLPTSERQCREIAKLPLQNQTNAWLTSVEKAGGKVPSGRIIKEVVNEIKGVKPKMYPKPKKDGPVRVPGIGIEFIVNLDEETYHLLQAYKEKNGIVTNNGAIRRLLDEQNQSNN